VIDESDPGPWRKRSRDGIGDGARVHDRIGNLDKSDRRAPLARGELGGVQNATVAEIGDEDLVSGRQRERAKHRVRARRRVVDEHQVVAPSAHELGHRGRGDPHSRWTRKGSPHDRGPGQLAKEESGGLPLDLVPDRSAASREPGGAGRQPFRDLSK
jgi:hypothetical protein